ncbi:potassium channel subfamily K member 16-like [Anneissia japonica]|uniref:potassium channel subfamily K member 16-like n=1 Tax=Anneissia japonica TaxID=1529436 RepID=UPI0014255948|nr:potassium channel subfamily K member 16-like [Anneissia japonica]
MMEVEDQVQPSYHLSRKEKFMRYFRKFIQWLFSYVGLTAILVGYLFLGAIVFQAIEGPEEQRLKHVMVMEKTKLLKSFYNKCTELNYTDWQKYAIHELNKFDMKTNAKNGTMGSQDRGKWDFFGSMLFSLTVVTTIGYGHIAPMTIHGQVICIMYALIGIPLMLLVLTNVGRVLANTARLLFRMYSSQLCKKVRCQDRRSQQRRASKRKKSIQMSTMASITPYKFETYCTDDDSSSNEEEAGGENNNNEEEPIPIGK